MISMHLSRVLSPVTLILTPSVLEVRTSPLLKLPAEAVGVMGVEGVREGALAVVVDAVDAFRMATGEVLQPNIVVG